MAERVLKGGEEEEREGEGGGGGGEGGGGKGVEGGMSVFDLLGEVVERSCPIRTFSERLDEALGGGVQGGLTTEIYGDPGEKGDYEEGKGKK